MEGWITTSLKLFLVLALLKSLWEIVLLYKECSVVFSLDPWEIAFKSFTKINNLGNTFLCF